MARVSLWLWIFTLIAAALPVLAEPPRDLDLVLGSPPGEIELLMARPDGRVDSLRRPVAADGRLTVAAGCVEGAVYWVASAQELSLPVVVDEGSPCQEGEPHPVAMLPTVAVSGTLDRVPSALDGQLARVDAPGCDREPGGPGPPSFFPVAVEEKSWRARLPRGCRSLRLELTGATPVSFGPLELGEDVELPPLRPSQAPAVAGRVVQGESGRALAGAQVRAIPEGSLARALTAHLRGQVPSFEAQTTTDDRGWFRLPDLPEDDVRLLVTAPGRAPAWSPVVESEARFELLVPALEVDRQASISVFAEPTEGQALRVAASANLSESWLPEPLLSARFPDEGAARLDGLFASQWLIELIVMEPPDRVDVLARVEVHLLPGEDRVVILSDADSPYRGRVTFEGEGLAARLRFSPVEGPGDVKVTQSAEDGLFEVLLDEPGRYRVEATAPGISAVVPEVEMQHRDERVEVELPEGRISGRVEGEGGPQPGAAVEALNVDAVFDRPRGQPAIATAKAGAEGEFVLRGLIEGEWVLQARSAGWSSRPVAVALGEDGEVDDVRINLERTSRLSLRILAPSGAPAAGARASVAAVPEEPVTATVREGLSAEDGGLSFELPPGAIAVNVAVYPPDHPAFAWRLPGGAVAELRLPSQAGSVRLILPPSSVANLPALMLATGAEGLLSLADLVFWGGATLAPQGDSTLVEIPRLGSGPWRLHRVVSMDEAVSLMHAPTAATPIAAFDLPPGGAVELSVPERF